VPEAPVPPLDSAPDARGGGADGHPGELVPDSIEEAAETIEASARQAGRRASSTAHAVTSTAADARPWTVSGGRAPAEG
jgi:hypothetical protein